MEKFSKLTFDIFDGAFATSDYSSLEISPLVDSSPLADMLEKAIKSCGSGACGEFSPMLETRLPCLDIADYMKQERSRRKLLFFCEAHDCGCSCDISASLRHKGGAVTMDQFVHRRFCYDDNQVADSDLGLQPFVFEKNEYFSELERVKHVLAAKEQTDRLALPTAQMKVYHNEKEARFFVRSTDKHTWIHPDNDETRELEALADGSLHVIIPLGDKAPGDKILVCFDNIEWEHSAADEQLIVYGGHNEGFYYGICVPDDESSDSYDSNQESSFLMETVLLEDNPDRYLFRDIQFEITKCKERDRKDFIVITIAWCSDEKEYAEAIATAATW